MSRSIRIVFLLDVNQSVANIDDESDIENRTASIRSSCLKLINFFIHRRLKDYTKVQWGYKFYSSNSSQKDLRSHRQSFIEFELEHFEEFEESFISCVKKNHERKINDANVNLNPVHAQTLNIILRDLLHDFDWDSPDIATPDKVRKKSKAKRRKSSVFESERDKYVFVISKCPWSRVDLYHFLGKQEENSNVILSPILMSTEVRNSYVTKKQIRVFWLDVDDENLLDRDDVFDGYDIINKALKNISGNVIPISSLLDTSKPFESILDWYFYPDDTKINKYQSNLIFKGNDDAFKMELFTFHDSKIYQFSELIQSNSEFYPISVIGTSYKRVISSQNCFGCLPCEENKEKFYHLLSILMCNNMNLVINCNGCPGILYPVSATLSILCLMSIMPRKFSLDTLIKKKTLDYPKSSSDLSKLDKKNKKAFNNISDYLETKSLFTTIGSDYKKPDFLDPFSFNYITKWFIPNSISFLPDAQLSEKQDIVKTRESELFALLADCLNESETSSSTKNEFDKTTASPIHLPKVSSKLKVSERSSGLVIQSLKNLKAKKEELKTDVELKVKLTKKPPRSARSVELVNGLENLYKSDEEKLIAQLKEYYQNTVGNNQSLLTCADNIINVIIYHIQMNNDENSIDIAKRLLNNELFKTPTDISKEYDGSDSNNRFREYELQALLRMEAITAKISNEKDCEKFVEEVIMQLRTLMLYSSPSRLSVFLKETILPNYSDSLPEYVITIFEELNQKLPRELCNDSSSDEDEPVEIQTSTETDSKTVDSGYQSHSSASSSAKSSNLTSNRNRNRKASAPIYQSLMKNRTIIITAKQKARLKLKIPASNSTSDVEPRPEKNKKSKNKSKSVTDNSSKAEKVSSRRSLFTSTSNKVECTPKKNTMSYDDVVFETPMEDLEKKYKKRGNFVIKETPLHKITRRLYTSDSQPLPNRSNISSKNSKVLRQSLLKPVRRILSSPVKLKQNQTIDEPIESDNESNNTDYVISTPVSKGQMSPEPLSLPSWKYTDSMSTSPPAPFSPEIDLWDESAVFYNHYNSDLESTNKDDDVFVEENECNNVVANASAFDLWKRKKPRPLNIECGKKRKSESELNAFEFAHQKKRPKSEIENETLMSTNVDKTPTKNESSQIQFTSPSSLSILHVLTSPVKMSKHQRMSS